MNDVSEDLRELSPAEVERLTGSGEAQLIDVRTEHEWTAGHLREATLITLAELSERAGEIDGGRPVVFYCRSGNRSGVAAEAFREAGHDAHNMEGGILAWVEAELPIEPGDGYVAESGEAAAILQMRRHETGDDLGTGADTD
jgi:rhodanese-related sulfurtransferase